MDLKTNGSGSVTDSKHVEQPDNVIGNDETSLLDGIEETKPGAWVWLITLCAAVGALLFGYDTGVISGVLVTISDGLGHELSDSEKELITSLTSGGAFVGAIIAGCIADRFGRRACIWFGAVLFTIGALVQAVAYSIGQMAAGRFIIVSSRLVLGEARADLDNRDWVSGRQL